MSAFGKGVQLATAGVGFFGGYLWAVIGWAGHPASGLVREALAPGAALAAAYAVLVALLFWPVIPVPRAGALRAVVSPAAFTLSFALGAAGIRGALWLLGSP